MWRNAHERYLEERVLSADPVELVHIMYDAAIGAVRDARRHLEDKDIIARSQSISKACNILAELNTALDFEHGGEFSARLSQLYGYMYRRLVEANLKQSDEPLAEVARLLGTLLDGWAAVRAGLPHENAAETTWIPTPFGEPELASASVGWSL